MVLCIVALVVFGIMGIFSSVYRPLAKEAFRCVFRMIRLKPCDTGFDEKIKSKITAKLLKRNAHLAKFTHRYFKAISTVFVIIFFASMVYSGYVIYNLTTYGTCDPHSGDCIFSPSDGPGCGGESCQEECSCKTQPCEGPDYEACDGDCGCKENTCG